MTVDRAGLEALVWRRMPADRKVSASATRFVAIDGTLTALATISDADLFAVLRKVNVAKTLTKALEAA